MTRRPRIYKRECAYFNEGSCCLPDRTHCQFCLSYRKPVDGLTVAQHVQMDADSRKTALSLILSALALVVSLGSLLVSYAKLVIDSQR